MTRMAGRVVPCAPHVINPMRHLILGLIFVSASLEAQTNTTSLQSPDGRLVIRFQTVSTNHTPAPAGRLVYDVTFRGKSLLEPSSLSLTLQGEKPLDANARIVNAT